MAALASPTWSEVLAMDPETIFAFTIVKGEMNGDEYLWDVVYNDPETGERSTGCWKSTYEKLNKAAHVAKPI